MNLAKAKEILHLEELGEFEGTIQDLNDAIRLGIEAITWFLLARVHSPGTVPDLLHGETKETADV